jgi:hypothetical protein
MGMQPILGKLAPCSFQVDGGVIWKLTNYGNNLCRCPTGIRTPVLALKGLRPGPLDDGGNAAIFYQDLRLIEEETMPRAVIPTS